MSNNNTETKKVIRIFEAFAGIGAQRMALTNIGANYKVEGMAEWYVPSIVSYQLIHNKLKIIKNVEREEMIKFLSSKTLSMNSKNEVRDGYWKRVNLEKLRIYYSAVLQSYNEGNIFDVRTLFKRTLKNIDILTYSFPCQDLSQQGKQNGMKKGSGTRSGLLWEIEKALEATPKNKRPKYLLMENVMSLTYKNNKEDLAEWLKKLEELGYGNDLKVLNAANFGSPQARRRAFMLSTFNGLTKLPEGKKNPGKISKILSKVPREIDFLAKLDKYKISDFKLTKSNINKARLPEEYTTFNSEAYVYDKKFTGPTLTASGANSRIKLLEQGRIRRINALEAFRYMGFKGKDYNSVNNINVFTENKMIFMCGNSISVEVLEEIFKEVMQSWNTQ